MRYLLLLILVGGILTGAPHADSERTSSANEQYFPLFAGAEWVYSVYISVLDSVVRQDTIRVDDVAFINGRSFYHLTTPWFPLFAVWARPDSVGDLYWCDSPGQQEHPLLLFSVELGTGWLLGGRYCVDSAARTTCFLPIETPLGIYEDAICLASRVRPGDCEHARWRAAFVAGVGPVEWELIGVPGLSVI